MQLNHELIQDVMVKFIFTISPVRNSRAAEREAVDALAETWPDFFQEPTGLTVRAAGPSGPVQNILLRAHKYYVKTQMGVSPALLLFPESLEIHLVLKMGGSLVPEFEPFPWADDDSILSKVKSLVLKLQSAYRFSVHRTAKVYDVQAFLPEIEQRLAMNSRLTGSRGEHCVELQHSKADAIRSEDTLYNVRTLVAYSVMEAEAPGTLVHANFDVNNREMSQGLNERAWLKIWKHGQSLRDRMIEAVFPVDL